MSNISRAALFDELVKIGEASAPPIQQPQESTPKKGPGHAVKAILTAGAGSALGYGAAELLARKLPYFQAPGSPEVLAKRVRAAKIILPILSGGAVILADRYRHAMERQYEQVRGYKDRK